jgi:hypothetical protein
VLGTTILGTILTAGYRGSVVLPSILTAAQRSAAEETLGGAVAVAAGLPAGRAELLLASARDAFGTGIGPTAWIGLGLVLAAAVVALVTLRKAR